jgi:hypothetical protein
MNSTSARREFAGYVNQSGLRSIKLVVVRSSKKEKIFFGDCGGIVVSR